MSQKDGRKKKSKRDAPLFNEPSAQGKDTRPEQILVSNKSSESGKMYASKQRALSGETASQDLDTQDNQEYDAISTPDLEISEQDPLCNQNVALYAKFSYELEEKREQSLIKQSSQMLTAFSVTFGALSVAARTLIERAIFPEHKIFLLVGAVLLLLLGSMILAMISQWRYKYITLENGMVILSKLKKERRKFVCQANYDYQWIGMLTRIQESKKKNNDRRYRLIHASMIVFLVAIGSLVICSLIVFS